MERAGLVCVGLIFIITSLNSFTPYEFKKGA